MLLRTQKTFFKNIRRGFLEDRRDARGGIIFQTPPPYV